MRIPHVCPKCGCPSVRITATIQELSWRPRWFLFGAPVLVRETVGADCACRKCWWAWTVDRNQSIEAPAQPAHSMVKQQPPEEKKPEPKVQQWDSDLARDPRDKPRKR